MPRNQIAWTQEIWQRFIDLWMDGESPETIAEDLGCTVSTVRSRASDLRKKGVPLPTRAKREKIDYDALALRVKKHRAFKGEQS